jgi:ribonuclease D
MMRASFGFVPRKEVFDTMLAAQVLGYDKMGLVALTDRFFEAGLSKKGQKDDWSQRPLPEKMLAYASADVHYLEALADRLTEELVKLGRLEWHRESCKNMVKSTESRNQADPEKMWRIKGLNTLGRRQLAFVRELWQWRENEARISDLPPFRIMGNHLILALAKWAANPKESADNAPKLPRHFTGRRLVSFKEALDEARGMPKEQWPEPPVRRPRTHGEPDCRAMIDRLRAEVGRLGDELKVDASVLAPKAAIKAISREKPGTVEEIMACGDLMRWQAELLLPVIQRMGGR